MRQTRRFRHLLRLPPDGKSGEFEAMTDIIVTALANNPQKGVLRFGHLRTRCALGRGGIGTKKVEGDGKTPVGRFALRRIWLRPDRFQLPAFTQPNPLPISIIRQKSGWCDDIHAPIYNRPVTRPTRFSHERLWRHDRLYDVLVELGHNDDPPQKGQGSAIFLHLENGHYRPTLGCVAINRIAMRHLLQSVTTGTHIEIKPAL